MSSMHEECTKFIDITQLYAYKRADQRAEAVDGSCVVIGRDELAINLPKFAKTEPADHRRASPSMVIQSNCTELSNHITPSMCQK